MKKLLIGMFLMTVAAFLGGWFMDDFILVFRIIGISILFLVGWAFSYRWYVDIKNTGKQEAQNSNGGGEKELIL